MDICSEHGKSHDIVYEGTFCPACVEVMHLKDQLSDAIALLKVQKDRMQSLVEDNESLFADIQFLEAEAPGVGK